MTHQSYEELIFRRMQNSGESISPEELNELEHHLSNCQPCRQLSNVWMEVENEFRLTKMLSPQPGFSKRWKLRLDAERVIAQRNQTRLFSGFLVIGIVITLGLLVFAVWPWIQSPQSLLWSWLYQIVEFSYIFGTLGGLISTVFRISAGVFPLSWWFVFVGLMSQLIVLWIVSYRKLTMSQRIQK